MALYTDLRSVNVESIDAAAINNAIRNILLTKKGSMPGKPTFGSNLSDVLFNQLDHITVEILSEEIQEALAEWEPRIIVNNVSVKQIPEYNKIVATIDYEYRDKGLNINEQISVAFVS